ncbi:MULTISPECIES: hypothetical protein [unclassified Janthinobacterium]|uniref:hypothetical protein n=1 Tax=unclassified Janthinobacterium TaxID=2610881 RepID=UPI0011133F00|nr:MULTISPECIES: hypothetical protein [unclassified Janthinobacterium]
MGAFFLYAWILLHALCVKIHKKSMHLYGPSCASDKDHASGPGITRRQRPGDALSRPDVISARNLSLHHKVWQRTVEQVRGG